MYLNNDIDWLNYLRKAKVYIFGGGFRGRNVLCKLKKYEIEVLGFIDNNTQLQGQLIYDKEVISLDDYCRLDEENIIVICSAYELEIKKQLLDKHIFNFISQNQIDFGGGVEHYDKAYFEWQKEMGKFGGRIKTHLFQPYISEEDVLVEFGAGGGYLINNLMAKEKIAIEINTEARKNIEAFGVKAVATADQLDDNYADVIISNSVLEHVENPLGELRKLYNILKPGGRMVFYVPNESCETEYYRSDINNHLYTWNCLNIGNLFKAAGFFIHKVERVQEMWPSDFINLEKNLPKEVLDEIIMIKGKAFDANRCLIIAYKT